MASGEMSPAEFIAFLERVLSNLAAHSGDGSIHFICMDWRHIGELLLAADLNYRELQFGLRTPATLWVREQRWYPDV
jgi:hypothetical protein